MESLKENLKGLKQTFRTRQLYGSKDKAAKSYRPENNWEKDDRCNFPAEFYNIYRRWKNHL